jgi:hypothetical protein
LARHHFVKNISCSKHLEEEAVAPCDDELDNNVQFLSQNFETQVLNDADNEDGVLYD